MPNRILKETICTSETVDALTVQAEMFFYRLLVQADDYGRMDARPSVLRARCFPLRLEQVQERHIKKWLGEMAEVGLIYPYSVEGAPYVQFVTWAKHQQVRNLRARYPAPPDGAPGPREHPLPVERDVEDLICEYLAQVKVLGGEPVQSVDRQVRIGESYLDVVLKTETKTLVLEIKRVRLSNKAIEQLAKYLGLTGGLGVLIGSGIAADFNLDRCRQSDIAVLTYDDALLFDVISPSSIVTTCEILGFPVTPRYALNPNPNPISNPTQNPNPPRPASPAGSVAPVPSKRDVLKALEAHFASLTGLALPPRDTESEKRESSRRWWEPLWAIYQFAGGIEEAKTVLAAALVEMDGRKLTVAAPQSVQQVAGAIHARQMRGANGSAPAPRTRRVEDPAATAQLEQIVRSEQARIANAQPNNRR